MLTRRDILLGLGSAALGWPLAAWPQQKKHARIGYLANDPDEESPTFKAFLAGLKEKGWIRNQNVEIFYLPERRHCPGGDFETLARDLVKREVDVIVATGSAPTRAAMKATPNIPIVFGSAADPVTSQFVEKLSRPGGNVTGLATQVGDLGSKRVELLKEMLPRVKVIGRIYQEGFTKADQEKEYIDADTAAARNRGLQLQQCPVIIPPVCQPPAREEDRATIDRLFGQIKKNRVAAVYVKADPFLVVNRGMLADAALRHRVPIMGPDGRFTDDGALFSYGDDFRRRYHKAGAVYVDRILRGVNPAVIPVDEPPKPELVLNLSTAKILGISVPKSLRVLSERTVR